MIYFDNASTTKPLKEVLDIFNKENTIEFANPNSINSFGMHLNSRINRVRNDILKLFRLNVSEYEVIFTSGATESNNIAIIGYCLKYKNRGKHIITSKIEHESVLNCFRYLETLGFEVTYLDCDENGNISLDELKNVMRNDTILVSIMASNNEVGSTIDFKKIREIIGKFNKCSFHSDVAQAINKVNLDYSKVDMFNFSFHKINGLKGSGLLIKKKKIQLEQVIFGGNQEFGYRSGTVNAPSLFANYYALEVGNKNLINHYNHVYKLNEYLRKELGNNREIEINTSKIDNPYILSISLKNKLSSVVVEALSNKNIYVNTTSACNSKTNEASHVLLAMKKSEIMAKNVIRISLSYENTLEECRIFLDTLNEILSSLRG